MIWTFPERLAGLVGVDVAGSVGVGVVGEAAGTVGGVAVIVAGGEAAKVVGGVRCCRDPCSRGFGVESYSSVLTVAMTSGVSPTS